MKQLLIRKLINCGIFAIFAFLIESISFLFMWGTLAKYWFLDLMFFFILSLPIFLSKKHLLDLIYLPIMMIITYFFKNNPNILENQKQLNILNEQYIKNEIPFSSYFNDYSNQEYCSIS